MKLVNKDLYLAFEIKMRHGFDLYHRQKHGYYASWDSRLNEYVVMGTQEQWNKWRWFFDNWSKEVLETISHEQMAKLYTTSDCH